MPKKSKKYPPLTREQQRLVEDNMDFARFLLASMLKSARYNRADRDDLEGAAFLGLCVAARGFDPSRGRKFTTYAAYPIEQHIEKANNAGGVVSVPPKAAQRSADVRAKADAAWRSVPFADRKRRSPLPAFQGSPYAIKGAAEPEAGATEGAVGVEREDRREEAMARLAPLLADLTASEKDYVRLHYLDGMQVQDAASLRGVCKQTASAALERARQKMRRTARRRAALCETT